jgi:hypothetical protein
VEKTTVSTLDRVEIASERLFSRMNEDDVLLGRNNY